VPVVIGGDNLPSPVGVGLIDLPNMGGGGASGPPGLPGSGTTACHFTMRHPVQFTYLPQTSVGHAV